MGGFMVTLDNCSYKTKPDKYEVGVITRRMQRAGATECDAATLCEHVRQGRTWVGGCYEPCRGDWGEFVGQQVFALDFDNDTVAIGADGKPAKDADGKKLKRPLFGGEAGYLAPLDALARCEQLSLAPLFLYFTMSARPTWWPKYRLVFDMGEPLGQDAAEGVLRALLAAFPEADAKCKNCNRLYFGGNGEVWECWRVWGDA